MSVTDFLLVAWLVIVIAIALRVSSGWRVYWLSVILSLPSVIWSQVEYELLPMAGAIHVAIAGLYPLLLFKLAGRIRRRTKSPARSLAPCSQKQNRI